MIKIENVEVVGLEHAIRGMRNPMNSWDKSDSYFGMLCDNTSCEDCPESGNDDCVERLHMHCSKIGPNDLNLMKSLSQAGTDHRKFMRMITVYLDITAPLYWWKEFDTYKVGTVANSCSTMHKIHEKEFVLSDFSQEHLFSGNTDMVWIQDAPITEDDLFVSSMDLLGFIITTLNAYREEYLKLDKRLKEEDLTKEERERLLKKRKDYWWQMIQLLPSSYNQRRTIMLNYEVLANIYKSRKNHKLDEWREFCKWIESLPYHELITGEEPAIETPNEMRDRLHKSDELTCEGCKYQNNTDIMEHLENCIHCKRAYRKLIDQNMHNDLYEPKEDKND